MSIRTNSKGYKVLETFADAYPDGVSRQAAATANGCTVQRVGEVVRANPGLVVPATILQPDAPLGHRQVSGYSIDPSDWAAFSREALAASVSTPVAAEPTPKLTLVADLTEAESDADLYKRVMLDTAAASDEDFAAAQTFAKAKKRKAPKR